MNSKLRLILVLVKFISRLLQFFRLGAGATWPGEIALRLEPRILGPLLEAVDRGIILVSGTNGKTTTSFMLKRILEQNGCVVIHNQSGANLLNGVISAFGVYSHTWGQIQADWAVLEVDENSLPGVISNLQFTNPKQKVLIIILNLFRDQLDRYGEVDYTAEKWKQSLLKISTAEVQLILNADDPLICNLGTYFGGKVAYFGINDRKQFTQQFEHATDSGFCSVCGTRLKYQGVYFSHLGLWFCAKCKLARPETLINKWKAVLPGLYNQYNTHAAVTAAKIIGYSQRQISKSLAGFQPAFGRQEEFKINRRRIIILLSKNPAGFNVSLKTALADKVNTMLLILNDRIPDGRDVSWIWDVDFEMIPQNLQILVSGDRAYDMALRVKYAGLMATVEPNLHKALNEKSSDTLYVLATYSAMLEVRKILTGRKI